MSVMNKPDYKIFAQDAKSGEYVAFPDILRGWGITLEQYGGFPPMELFNSAAKRIDEWLMYLTQRGLPEWDAVVDYPKDAMTQHAGVYYVSLKANKNEQPNNSQASWKKLTEILGVDGKLAKDQNGADIPNKDTFIKNLGLPELLDKKFDKTGGVVTGEITSTGITRAKNVSTIELNPNDSRPRLTSKVGEKGEWNSSYLQQKTGTIAHLDDIPAATSIVQGVGQSTTSVISQKGVTDALSAHGIGYGQQYMNMTGSRQPGSWYPNNTGRPIFIMVSVGRDSGGGTEQSAANISFQVGSEVISIPVIRGANSGGAQRGAGSALIPDGAIYTVTTEFGSEVKTWWELR